MFAIILARNWAEPGNNAVPAVGAGCAIARSILAKLSLVLSLAVLSRAGARQNTVAPSLIVSVTWMSAIVVGGTAVGSFERMTKSASLPTSRLPLVSSSKIWQAGQIVIAFRQQARAGHNVSVAQRNFGLAEWAVTIERMPFPALCANDSRP